MCRITEDTVHNISLSLMCKIVFTLIINGQAITTRFLIPKTRPQNLFSS